MWNLALDHEGGPQSTSCGVDPPAGCEEVRGSIMSAPVVVDTTGDEPQVRFTREYYEMGHLSKFVRPGAVRLATNAVDGVDNVAFENADGSRVLVVHNPGEAVAAIGVNVGDDSHFEAEIPPGGIATYRWSPPGATS
jgi:glucosylceramidase